MQINSKMLPTQEFDGCDGGDPGSPTSPTIWIFGIEHGTYRSPATFESSQNHTDDGYTIQTQLTYPYNQKAFKLLAVINGLSIEDYRVFAEKTQPFVKGSKGYFKGNLYPYACRSVSEWTPEAELETGMTKIEYKQWCNQHHIPAIKKWVDQYQPKVFIGVGNSNRTDFSQAVFGNNVNFETHQFTVGTQTKKIFYAKVDGRRLVVIPHLSGGKNGLNSHESVRVAGKFIAEFIQ